jgi:hypothetical protein
MDNLTCPICAVVMRQDVLVRHCFRHHKEVFVASMPIQQRKALLDVKMPFAVLHNEKGMVIKLCMHCGKGSHCLVAKKPVDLTESHSTADNECVANFDKYKHYYNLTAPVVIAKGAVIQRSVRPEKSTKEKTVAKSIISEELLAKLKEASEHDPEDGEPEVEEMINTVISLLKLNRNKVTRLQKENEALKIKLDLQ